MKSLTVNQVRVRLGKIMEKVGTPSFKEIYEDIAEQMDGDVDKLISILNAHMDTIDAYTLVVSDYLMDTDKLEQINSFMHPLVAYGFYNRYYSLTKVLMDSNQDEMISVPSSDKAFFTHMLITFWKDSFVEQRHDLP